MLYGLAAQQFRQKNLDLFYLKFRVNFNELKKCFRKWVSRSNRKLLKISKNKIARKTLYITISQATC